MSQKPNYTVSKVSGRGIAIAIVSLYLVLILGLIFHTSIHPTVFGKYSLPYLMILVLLWVFVPFLYFFIRFACSSQRIEFVNGQVVELTPWIKIPNLLLLVFAGLFFSEIILHYKEASLTQSRKEYQTHHFHPFLQNTRPLGLRPDPHDTSFNIFIFGGSTAESLDFTRVEQQLRERFRDLNVRIENVAVKWYTSLHSLIRLVSLVQDYTPNHVVLYHGINDLYRGCEDGRYAFKSYSDDYSHFSGSLVNMLSSYTDSSSKYSLVIGKLFQQINLRWFSDFRSREVTDSGEPIFFERWRSLQAFERNLNTFVDNATRLGATVTIASQPTILESHMTTEQKAILSMGKWFCIEDGKTPNSQSLSEGMQLYNAASRRVARIQRTRFLDLERVVPKDTKHFSDDVHYHESAKTLIQNEIAEHLNQLLVSHAG